MHSDLGEKIGEGAVADVHAWAPGQVVKLFKTGVPKRFGLHEARVTRAIFAAGGPAPEVHGEVTVAGRFGIVLTRYDGPSLIELSRNGAVTRDEAGAMLATLARAVHATPAPHEVPPLRDQLEGLLPVAGDRIPARLGAGILPMLARLPLEDGLCHGDLHTGNVIITADGPRLIDWTGALRAPAALELATCHIIHTEAAAHLVPDPDRPRAVNAAMQSAYARLIGMSPEALDAEIAAYLPLARVLALLIGAWPPALRPQLIARIEESLEL